MRINRKTSTLGLTRQAYTIMNDYNTDLLTALKSLKVRILKTEAEVFGGNPLNPTSIIVGVPGGLI